MALCGGASTLRPVALKELFIPSKVTLRVSLQGCEGDQSSRANSPTSNAPVRVTLYRKDKGSKSFDFNLSYGDVDIEREGTKIEIGLHELGDNEDAFVLMCAEDDNRFENYTEVSEVLHHVPILITADDDLLSPYGKAKWATAIRSVRDACMFAGPCTAGSPWSRLNRSISKSTKVMLSLKQET